MISRRSTVLLAATAVATAIGVPATAHAAPGDIRYATPTGSGTACTAASPCSLVTAINTPGEAKQVVVEPGSYGSVAHPINDTLEPHIDGLFIHGVAGQPLPVIHTSVDYSVELDEAPTTLTRVEIDSSGASSALYDTTGTVSHVIVRATGAGTSACTIYTTLTDSLCVATGVGGAALSTSSGSGGPGTDTIAVGIRGVTAIATDPAGIGLQVSANTFTTINLKATNDIFRGGFADVDAETDASSGTVAITLDHSDYITARTEGTGSSSVTALAATNVAKPPQFVNAPAGNYRLKGTSPLIDKGAADPANDTDLAGRPRTLGAAPDIGAYEVLQRPVVRGLHKHAVTKHSASFTAAVNAEGLTTRVRLIASHGHSTRHSRWISAAHARKAHVLHLRVHGLKPGKKYSVRLVAINAGGTTTSARASVRTTA